MPTASEQRDTLLAQIDAGTITPENCASFGLTVGGFYKLCAQLKTTSGGGGGGSYLPLAGGTMDDNATIGFDNGSAIREAGEQGLEIECSVGYRWQWIAGRMNMVQINTNQIIKTIAIDGVNPGVYDDVTDGFVVGSRWETVDGTIYECTDTTEDAAVWEARTIASQQVHWQKELANLGWGSSTIEGNWPQLLEINNSNGNNDNTGVRFLGKAPNLISINISSQLLDNTAQAALLADVARNAQEHDIHDGTLDISSNPGALDLYNSEVSANFNLLEDLGWTVSHSAPPTPVVVSAVGLYIDSENGIYGVTATITIEGTFDEVQWEVTGDPIAWGGTTTNGLTEWTAAVDDMSGPWKIRARTQRWGVFGAWVETVSIY